MSKNLDLVAGPHWFPNLQWVLASSQMIRGRDHLWSLRDLARDGYLKKEWESGLWSLPYSLQV